MKSLLHLVLPFSLVWGICFSSTVVSQEASDIIYTRLASDDGSISKQSRKNLKRMLKLAKHDGSVLTWVGFDIFFTPIPEQRDAAYLQQFEEDMSLATRIILDPLVEAGSAEILPTPDKVAGAPGRLVRLSSDGLKALSDQPLVSVISLLN